MARALDLRLKGRGFDPRPFRFPVTTLGKLFAYMCLRQQTVNLVRSSPAAGKVTVGLASHCPCVTDFYSPTGSRRKEER